MEIAPVIRQSLDRKAFCNHEAFSLLPSPSRRILPGQRRSTPQERFWAKVVITSNAERCWTWNAYRSNEGYGRIRFAGTIRQATHVAWYLAYGRFPQMMLLHSCDNPACVNVRHLREGTNTDNMRDMSERGRSTIGEKSGVAKLTDQDVLVIRKLRADGIGQREVGRRFRISHTNVRAIERRETWRHV